jgi:VacB/RNase II family 3'-5' exoribonuclease
VIQRMAEMADGPRPPIRPASFQKGNAMNAHGQQHRAILRDIAHRVMLERGFLPDFSAAALDELAGLQALAAHDAGSPVSDPDVRDLRNLLWASIDNDDSRDLDQLTVAESVPGNKTKILIAIADVDSLVHKGLAIDAHAQHNTTSIYTAAEMFPMLPEELSTNLTSLNPDEDRLAVVVEVMVGADGTLGDSAMYTARVRNHAKLAYNSVAAWLEGTSSAPDALSKVAGLDENLRLQDKAAQSMKNLRHVHGALSLETIEARPVFDGEQLRALESEEMNRAKQIIEDFMIAANGATARYLSANNSPSIRRVVRTPKRWDRIVELAAQHNSQLPEVPDSRALEEFLVKQKAADPLRFPDLSLAVIKLLGSGEYVAELPDGNAPGHFGLAVRDYAHSTAPNRRYPDLLTQRLLKAAMTRSPLPYDKAALDDLAAHCTQAEDDATKVERRVEKSAAALLLESRIGEQFDSIVTGASDKGTWVRLLSIPIEGKVVAGFQGLDVGDRVRVQLTETDVERGFIDFRKVGSSKHG